MKFWSEAALALASGDTATVGDLFWVVTSGAVAAAGTAGRIGLCAVGVLQ